MWFEGAQSVTKWRRSWAGIKLIFHQCSPRGIALVSPLVLNGQTADYRATRITPLWGSAAQVCVCERNRNVMILFVCRLPVYLNGQPQ